MSYDLQDVLHMLRTYHLVELEAEKFWFIAAFPRKDKAQKVKSAQTVLNAIEEYKKLPLELRKELEKDKSAHVSKLVELERICKESIA